MHFRVRIRVIGPGSQHIHHSCQLFHFIKHFIFIVDYVHLRMVCGYVRVNIAALEAERGCKTSAVELPGAGRHPTWVLEAKLGPSPRAVNALNP